MARDKAGKLSGKLGAWPTSTNGATWLMSVSGATSPSRALLAAHPREEAHRLSEELKAGEVETTPLIALTGIGIALGLFIALVIALVFVVAYLI